MEVLTRRQGRDMQEWQGKYAAQGGEGIPVQAIKRDFIRLSKAENTKSWKLYGSWWGVLEIWCAWAQIPMESGTSEVVHA